MNHIPIKINPSIFKRIEEAAKATGETVEEFVHRVLAKAIHEAGRALPPLMDLFKGEENGR